MSTARGGSDGERERLLAARPEAELELLARLLSELTEATEHDAGASSHDAGPAAPRAQGDWRRWS